MDLKPEAHVAVQAAVQRWVDSAISKTTNCPSDYTVKQTNDLYMLAYDLGCKGITIYRDNSREIQVLNNIQEEDDVIACSLDDPECTTCAL
jgi:ribonucleoside-diphosphate reductase alpha chain